MSKVACERARSRNRPGRDHGWDSEPTQLVCGSLALAVVVLALRIANVWP